MPLSRIASSMVTDKTLLTVDIADNAVTGDKIEDNPTIAGNLSVTGDFLPSLPLTNKNIIINGNFAVDQRGSVKASGIHTGNGDYNLDKWTTEDSGNIDNLVMNITQDADTPNGFDGYCLKYQCMTAESAVAADEFYSLNQYVESRNLQHLGFGTEESGIPSHKTYWQNIIPKNYNISGEYEYLKELNLLTPEKIANRIKNELR